MTLFLSENIVVNRTTPVNGKTNVEKNTNGVLTKTGEAEIRYEDNKLMFMVSKSLIDTADGFNFKWQIITSKMMWIHSIQRVIPPLTADFAIVIKYSKKLINSNLSIS